MCAEPKKSVEESGNFCLQLSAADGFTMSRRKQAKPQHIDSDEPASLGNGEFTHGRRDFSFNHWKKFNTRRSTSRLFKLSFLEGGFRLNNVACRTLTCCGTIEVFRQIRAAFRGRDFSEHNTGAAVGTC